MALNLIADVNDPDQNGLIIDFLQTGRPTPQDFVRNDKMLAIVVRPVVASGRTDRPWSDDSLSTDTYQVAISLPDALPTGGLWPISVLGSAFSVTSNSVANPTVVTAALHGLTTGDSAYITGNTGSTPDINGTHIVTVTGANTFTIPVNVTVGGTGGTVSKLYTNSSLTTLESATSFQTAVTAISVAAGRPTVTVRQLSPLTFEVTWTTNAIVPSMISGTNTLTPDSVVNIAVDEAGSASTQAVQIVTLRQSPVAYSTPNTQLPVASVTSTVSQSGSATQNKIYSVTFTDGTYSGTYSMSVTVSGVAQTVGVVEFGQTPSEISTILQNYTGSTADDFAVTVQNSIVTVEFKGAYGLSNGPVLAVTNIDLLAPLGVSGTIALNTFSLARAFYATTANTLSYTLAIRRTRASGEDREYLQVPVILKRNIIDVTTMVPVLFPNYITKSEADTYYQSHDSILDDLIAGLLNVITAVVTGDLTVNGSAIVNTDLNLGGDALISGNANVSGDVSGNLITAGDFSTTGTVTADSDITSNGIITSSASLVVSSAGFGLKVKEGANAKQGIGTLVAGVCTVATTAVLSTSHVFPTHRILGGTPGILTYTIINATSFTVTSTNVADTSTFDWLITDPA